MIFIWDVFNVKMFFNQNKDWNYSLLIPINQLTYWIIQQINDLINNDYGIEIYNKQDWEFIYYLHFGSKNKNTDISETIKMIEKLQYNVEL